MHWCWLTRPWRRGVNALPASNRLWERGLVQPHPDNPDIRSALVLRRPGIAAPDQQRTPNHVGPGARLRFREHNASIWALSPSRKVGHHGRNTTRVSERSERDSFEDANGQGTARGVGCDGYESTVPIISSAAIFKHCVGAKSTGPPPWRWHKMLMQNNIYRYHRLLTDFERRILRLRPPSRALALAHYHGHHLRVRAGVIEEYRHRSCRKRSWP